MIGSRHHGAGLVAGLLAWTLGAATAHATCMGLPDTLTLRGPTCEPLTGPPDKLGALRHDAALPLTFTYTRGTVCCAGSAESCSRQIEPISPAMILDFAGRAQGRLPNGVRIRALLRAPDALGATIQRGIREVGITCEGEPLLELTGGPLQPGTIKLADHTQLTTRAGVLSEAARTAQLAALRAAKPGLALPYQPPEPMTIPQALDVVRRADQSAALAQGAEVTVTQATGLVGLDEPAASASALLPVQLTWTRSDDGAAARAPGLILRTTGMICVGEQACFGALAAEAGLFEAKSPLTPRAWAALYLWLAGEAPARFVDRDKRDATILPAKREREDAQHVSLSACYQVAGDKRTRCFAQRFTHPDAP